MIWRMKLRLVVEFDPEPKRWSAVFPDLPGCGSAGDTEDEAVANEKEALALWFEPTELELGKGVCDEEPRQSETHLTWPL
jgi:predicted RNase H-like HicB family nuclease